MRRFGARTIGVVLAAALAAPAGAQVVGGPIIRVSTQPLDPTAWATTSVATLLDGDLVVVWWDARDGVFQAFAQRFDAWGHRLGAEIAVAASTGQHPRVAATAAGGFVVVWGHNGVAQARCFDTDGVPGPIFAVGTGQFPDVASDSAGNFVVAWTESSGGAILAQRFSGPCAALGATITASPISSPNPLARAAVAAAPDGRFLVAWEGTDAVNQQAVFARRYGADGTAAGPAFQVNDTVLAYLPAASMAASGGFVVVFGGPGGIWARRFDASGTASGPQFEVMPTATMPDVAHTATGTFVVTWLASDPQLGPLVSVRHYTAAGTAGPVVVAGTTYFPAGFRVPAIAAQPDESVAVTWTHRDGPQEEIVLRRFGPVAGRESAFDGNGVLEPGEDVQVIPTWANGTGSTATLSGVATTFDGPSGPGVTYGLLDASASYGTVADGATASCSATGDCYRAGVSAPAVRPAAHWDARLDEVLAFGGGTVTHRWPVHVGVSFTDVPASSGFYRFVETLVHEEVTGGCGGTAYCPAAAVTREQMAVFVLRSRHDGYLSWPCTGMFRRFNDVPATSLFCRWIEDLARRGVVAGCDATNYCPTAPVSRQEMAVFVLATKEASGYSPPACGAPLFADVPASSPFCPWIEELARRGVVTGCGGGNYCPASPVTREQMAVFLTLTFGLSLTTP